MKKENSLRKRNNQLTGNAGLFYVSYLLSKNGWNVLPTSRNAKGPDIVIYSQDFTRFHTVQVKSLSGRDPVPFSKSGGMDVNFLVICRCVWDPKPEVFVMSAEEGNARIQQKGKERKSYWLQRKDYESDFRDDELNKIGKGI